MPAPRRLRIALTVFVALILGAQASGPVDGSTYRIRIPKYGQYLDAHSGGSVIIKGTPSDWNDATWKLILVSGNEYHIYSPKYKTYLDAHSDQSVINKGNPSDWNDVLWKVDMVDDSHLHIYSPKYSTYLDGHSDGSVINKRHPSDMNDALWTLELLEASCMKIEAATGYWEKISSSPGQQHVTYTTGVTRSNSVQNTITWGSTVTATISASFGFLGDGGSESVSGEISSSIAREYSSTFSQTTTVEKSFDFGPGVVWQFQFKVQDGCDSIASGTDLQLTQGVYDPPCCLPGWFANISEPHGECHGDSPNVCEKPMANRILV